MGWGPGSLRGEPRDAPSLLRPWTSTDAGPSAPATLLRHPVPAVPCPARMQTSAPGQAGNIHTGLRLGSGWFVLFVCFISFCFVFPPFGWGQKTQPPEEQEFSCESDRKQSKYVLLAVRDLKINVPCDEQCWVRRGVASPCRAPSALPSAEACCDPSCLLSQSNAEAKTSGYF